MKLGMLVVYFVRPKMNWFVKLQLNQIKRNTKGVDYQIFAVPLRLGPTTLRILKNHPKVTLIESQATRIRGASKEHSYYLDKLVRKAGENGCTHFVTLDVDSFPIKPGWVNELSAQLCEQTPLAAVFRAENWDVCLPHPSGLMCKMDFFDKYQPSFYPGEPENDQIQAFSNATGQRIDTGIGYAMKLHQNGLDWIRLNRTNNEDIHPVMSGIYGDLFYHLGAMSRKPLIYCDWTNSKFRLFIYRNKELPLFRWVHRKMARNISERNDQIRTIILERLQSDPNKYFAELNGISNR